MQSITITDNLTRLTKGGMMNAYLVREPDGFTLVDTTLGAADALIAAAQAAGMPIVRILLTHGHGDHAGSVNGLRPKLGPEVPLLMTRIDAEILAGGPAPAPYKKRGSWPKLKTTPDTLISPGERIGSLEVIATPGHTPGHVSFLDTRDRSVIAGDAMSNIGGLAVPNHPHWRFPFPYFASCDRSQTLDSARALQALEPSVIAFGHGREIRDPQAAIDAAIATAAAKQRAA